MWKNINILVNILLLNKSISFLRYTSIISSIKNNINKIQIHMKKHNPNHTNTNNYLTAKTSNQQKYLKYLKDENIKILFAVGPAGTGKTYLACNEAITLLKSGIIQKIILTRPVVPVEEDIGFLPGSLNKKMDPWIKPIIDVFEEKYSKQDIERLIMSNIIEISPLAYMRGRTFKNAFIIADEMQNSSPNQMLMLTTRIGENSKMIVTGDIKQSDKPNASGLADFLQKYHIYRNKFVKNLYLKNNTYLSNYTNEFILETGIHVIELQNKDIQRSKVVSKILDIYDNNDRNNYYLTDSYSYLKNTNTSNSNSNHNEDNLNVTGNNSNNDAALIPKYLEKFLK
jgi:phosphate starvation-inducible PhoH-like protein